MYASHVSVHLPVVTRETSAVEAARLIAERDLVGVVVADESGTPVQVVSAIDVLRLMMPAYLLEDLSLVGVIDEAASEDLWRNADGRTVGELIDDDSVPVHAILMVDPDDTLIEVGARMVDAHAQIALVRGETAQKPSFVTLPGVIAGILTLNRPDARGGRA